MEVGQICVCYAYQNSHQIWHDKTSWGGELLAWVSSAKYFCLWWYSTTFGSEYLCFDRKAIYSAFVWSVFSVRRYA